MSAATRGFGAESQPPGELPQRRLGQDIMDAAFDAQGGARVRPAAGMSDRAMAAGFDRLFARAQQNDPEAVYKQPSESWDAAKARHDARRQ
jgi:hypothetical protein